MTAKAACMAVLGLCLAACSGLQMEVPPDFLRLQDQARGELHALTPDGAVLLVREFAVEPGAAIGFWAEAVAVDLEQARGHELEDAGPVRDAAGREGRSFLGTTAVAGQRCGYYLALFLLPAGWWPFAREHVRTVEFAAPRERFDAEIDAVRAAVATLR